MLEFEIKAFSVRNRYTQAALKGKSERDRAIRRRRGVTSFRNGKNN